MFESPPIQSVIAQYNILSDLQQGKGSAERMGLLSHEITYRKWLNDLSESSHTELVEKLKLNREKIEPAKSGIKVTFDATEKKKIVDHLLNICGLRSLHTFAEESASNFTDLKRKIISKGWLEAINQVEISMTGPLITLKFPTSRSMHLFGRVIAPNSIGICLPLPLEIRQEEGDSELIMSEVTYLNLVNKEDEPKTGQNVEKHEKWHAVDDVRNLIFRLHANEIPALSTNGIYESDPVKFLLRLSDYLYRPSEMESQLESLRNRLPELYDYLVKITPDSDSFTTQLMYAQNETSACIAGKLKGDTAPLNDQDISEIADFIEQKYLPLGIAERKFISLWMMNGPDGKKVFNRAKLDLFFNPMTASISEPPEELSRALNRYSSLEQGYLTRRHIKDPEKFYDDMQSVIDFFNSPDGYGYQMEMKIKKNIIRAIKGFSALASLRGNNILALLEISLLPISHWEVYAQRQIELNDLQKGK